jgi:hypothetical protein
MMTYINVNSGVILLGRRNKKIDESCKNGETKISKKKCSLEA